MRIDKLTIKEDCYTVVSKLQDQLRNSGSNLLAKIKKSGEYTMICCPYHKNGEERRPSAQVRNSDGLFYCFACKKTTSFLEMLSYCLKADGRSWIVNHFITVDVVDRQIQLNFTKDIAQQTYVTEEELDSYRYIHPYMYKRKLTDEVIELFDVGYDKKTNCLTFPIRDRNGNVLFIARRSVQTKFFSYPENVIMPIYGEYELLNKHVDSLYICESILDALTIWSYGKYAIAFNGLGSYHQLELLQRIPIREFILATDNDLYGKNARLAIKKYVKHKILKEISYDSYGECKDINDMTLEQFNRAKIQFVGGTLR